MLVPSNPFEALAMSAILKKEAVLDVFSCHLEEITKGKWIRCGNHAIGGVCANGDCGRHP